MKIIRSSAVLEELIDLSFHIALDNEEAAHNFLNACNESFELLAKSVYISSLCNFDNPQLRDVRKWFVKGFKKYLIFYRPFEDGVEILHIIHGARDTDGYLKTKKKVTEPIKDPQF